MAKTKHSRGKLVRKFGENIFGNPKYDRLLNRKPYGPGQHAQSRRPKISNYGTQLREKQKIKFMYGLLEKQFSNTFKKAEKLKQKIKVEMFKPKIKSSATGKKSTSIFSKIKTLTSKKPK